MLRIYLFNMTCGQALAIAHNGNLSNGLMFDDVTLGKNSKPLDTDYVHHTYLVHTLSSPT